MRGSGLEGFLWLSTASFAWSDTKHYSRRYARLGQAARAIRGGYQIDDREKADLFTGFIRYGCDPKAPFAGRGGRGRTVRRS